MDTETQVAIIGAGPYGLSLAAYLRSKNVEYRIFGSPMHPWRTQMPKGMFLKSEGFASNLYDPASYFTLAKFCKQEKIEYADIGLPVALETFVSYGLAFQKRFVPGLETEDVAMLEKTPTGFRLQTSGGKVVQARRVVVAIGVSPFLNMPSDLAHLPEGLCSHSSHHNAVDRFKGLDVTVLGSGASALDLAASLHKAGAEVHLIARKPTINFNEPVRLPRSLMDRIRAPMSGLGQGWRSRFCTDAPLVFHTMMPEWLRLMIVQRHLGGAAPGWFIRDQVVGLVDLLLGYRLMRADVRGDRLGLELIHIDGSHRSLSSDHVIAATGYKIDMGRMVFLSDELRSQLRTVASTPILSANFESSIPGLYFVGPSAANSFGPLMRFAFGADFVARRLSRHLAKSASRRSVLGDLAVSSAR